MVTDKIETRALCPSKLDKNRQLLLPQTSTLPEQKQLNRESCRTLMFSIRARSPLHSCSSSGKNPLIPRAPRMNAFKMHRVSVHRQNPGLVGDGHVVSVCSFW